MTEHQTGPIYQVPDRLLHSDAFKAACAARDWSEIFRLINKRGPASYGTIAAATGLTASRVGDVIKGRRGLRGQHVIERVARGLGIPREWLRLDSGVSASTTTPSQLGDHPSGPNSHGYNECVSANLASEYSATTFFLPHVPATVEATISPLEMAYVPVLTPDGRTVLMPLDRRTFLLGATTAAIPTATPPARPLDGDLSDIVRMMKDLRSTLTAQDNLLGPRVVAPTVVHQVAILRNLSRNAQGKARQTLIRLLAAYAEFAGWLADDLGDEAAGQYWTDRALDAALEADDELVAGYILMRKAQRAAAADDGTAAAGLAQAAQRRGALTARVRAAAAQQEAQGHAMVGDVSAFRAAIERAREYIADAPAPEHGEWASWCTQSYVDIHEATGWMRLGEPAQAVAVYERALQDWPTSFRRDQGLYYSRLARAYAAARNPEQAAETGRIALEIATLTGSTRILNELKALPESLRKWGQLPAVKTFTAELRAVVIAPRTESAHQL